MINWENIFLALKNLSSAVHKYKGEKGINEQITEMLT